MIAHCRVWRRSLLIGIVLLAPGIVRADPEEVRHSHRDCPRSEYSRLHYWTPSVYQVRAYVHPSKLDQFPPGPAECLSAPLEINRYKCRAIPPTPSSPYADPESYYGRPIIPAVP